MFSWLNTHYQEKVTCFYFKVDQDVFQFFFQFRPLRLYRLLMF